MVNRLIYLIICEFYCVSIVLFSDGNDSDDLIVQAFKAYDLEGRYCSNNEKVYFPQIVDRRQNKANKKIKTLTGYLCRKDRLQDVPTRFDDMGRQDDQGRG